MLKRCLSILTFLLSTISWAQNFEVGSEFKQDRGKVYFEGVIGKQKESLLGVSVLYNRNKSNQLIINKFNYDNLKLTSSLDIEIPESKEMQFVPEQVFLVKEQLMLIGYKIYRKASSRTVGIYKIGDKGELSKFIQLDSILNVGVDADNVYKIIQGESENSFYYFRNALNRATSQQNLILKEYDEQANLINRYSKSLDKSFKKLHFYKDIYDDANNIYFLAEPAVSSKRNIKERVLQNNVHHLICWNLKNKKFKHIQLRLKDKWIHQLTLSMKNKSCIVAGNYVNSNENIVSGTVYVRLNENFKIVAHNFNPYSESTIEKLQIKNKRKNQIEKMLLKAVKTDMEGYTAIVSEKYRKETEQYFDPQTDILSFADVFHYDNLVITWLDSMGNQSSEQVILKEQSSANDDGIYSSVATFLVNDSLMIFLNDHEKNVYNFEESKPAKTASIYVEPQVIYCSKNGGIRKELLFDKTDKKIMISNTNQYLNALPSYILLESNRRNQIIRVTE